MICDGALEIDDECFSVDLGHPEIGISAFQERTNSGFRDCKKGRNLYPRCASREREVVVAPEGAALANRRSDIGSESNATESEKESLNFKVSPQFKKEFKGFAVSEGISMTDLLKEGFALSKKKRQK